MWDADESSVTVGPDGHVDRLRLEWLQKAMHRFLAMTIGYFHSGGIGLFLSVVVIRHWPLYQLLINNVFLHGE